MYDEVMSKMRCISETKEWTRQFRAGMEQVFMIPIISCRTLLLAILDSCKS